MSKINYKDINQKALLNAEQVVRHWTPDGSRNGHEWVALNPTRKDHSKGSFSINLNNGVWKDFSTDDGGSDLISLVAYVERCNQSEAAKSLVAFLGNTNIDVSPQPDTGKTTTNQAFAPIYPPPLESIALCPKNHPKLGDPVTLWDYLSAEGQLLMRVMRFESKQNGQRKKDFRPLTYGKLGNQTPRWHWRQLPKNRPLYRLETFIGQETVVICEGEKAADACSMLFPSCFVTSWSGGSKAIEKTDFEPLKNKKVILWPDNDSAGDQTIPQLHTQLTKVNVQQTSQINLEFFKNNHPVNATDWESTGHWPEKADAFEALEMGWTANHLKQANAQGLLLINPTHLVPESKDNVPYGFRLDESGVWFTDSNDNRRKICDPINIVARSRSGNGDGRNWGILIRFKDFDSEEKLWNISMQSFATDGGGEVIRGLMDRGLPISSHREAKRKILEYLQEYQTDRRVSLVYKMGWFKDSFVFPNSVVGEYQNAMYYSENPSLCKLSTKGNVSEWKSNIGKYCNGNPLALFAVSAALSAPLVELMGYESMGFHYYGDSSWGKSTLLDLACSVYGNPDSYKCTFRATDNALESLASAHSDMLLALDEINQVDARIIGDIIYMLGNGQGKHRANDRGQARDTQHKWKLTYLTNGEKTLEQYLLEGGKKVTGGMEMRFLGIQATFQNSEADKKHKGVFNHCHEFSGGAELSNHLKREMQKYHGSAFPAFIQQLVKQNFSTLTAHLVKQVDYFVSQNLSNEAGGQVQRAAAKFALVGMAGELATQWGITGWEKGQAYVASRECFFSWLKNRGGEGNMEDSQILNDLRLQLEMYGDSKFKRWDKTTKPVIENESTIIDTHVPSPSEMWGYRRHIDHKSQIDGDTQEVVYYIFPNAFEKVICKGNDHLRVARLLRDIGALELRDSELKENRLKTKERLPGSGRKYRQIYKIKGSILFESC
ncbi:DUF927 domain-containing protein [Planctobacterium marinum]|uniref:DUF927 domain-containing protein n=1 Tax=Planctobacterium marinum TaxID=1631968 RepID=UPI001E372354|nr:DUF927 domain-containing protein [Planctobacterium marinum]MCC2607338.1 DUF927 domain-containing protein [Planctobacterium marinum]